MTDIDRVSQSIGKRYFGNCHETATRPGDPAVDDLLACDPEPEGTSPKARRTRTSNIERPSRKGPGETGPGTMSVNRPVPRA